MLNIEYWKDELKKIGEGGCIVAVENNIPKLCDEVSCLNCDFYLKGKQVDAPARCERFYDWLCEEYKEPEIDWDSYIDWTRVPIDTEVLVKNGGSVEWENRFFAIYFPNSTRKYAAFGFHDKQAVAISADMWKFCKLKNTEDIEKYRRKDNAEH